MGVLSRPIAGFAAVLAASVAGQAAAQNVSSSVSLFGMPGLIDMPTARSLPDAEIVGTASYFGGASRASLAFQITPRLTGAFRYSNIERVLSGRALLDRSIDVHFLLLREGRYLPAVAVGIRDFGGTGFYSSEYLVATKAIGSTVEVSGGIGWGRLASRGGFRNPLSIFGEGFNTRPTGFGLGGTPNVGQWFRGPAALFAGVQWRATDRLTLKAEYSSDAYAREGAVGLFTAQSPFNFGAEYRVAPGVTLGGYYLYGAVVGVSASFAFNPKSPPSRGDLSPAPPPVIARGDVARSWGLAPDGVDAPDYRAALATELLAQGLTLTGLTVTGGVARVEVSNTRYDIVPQAVGRTARVLSRHLPAGVEVFEIVPVVEGIPTSRVVLRRSDIEALENDVDGARLSRARAGITDAVRGVAADRFVGAAAPFQWGIGPYLSTALFDPDNPLRFDVGIEATARYEFAPGLIASGAARLKVFGNLDQSTRVSDSLLPRVRSDSNLYDRFGSSGIEHLTLEYFARPAPDFYSRVTVGYLEAMYGGVSAEVLWKPVDSRLAFGVEVNYARQRDFNKLFGFQSYEMVTGHASAYYDIGNGFEAQLDVGRYLAGDWGATISVDRTFANGWKVGAFATFTDVPFARFGEGSFDKGIRLTVPVSWLTGRPTTTRVSTVIRPLLRDGGARLEVRNRLHGLVRDTHASTMDDQWGRFWR